MGGFLIVFFGGGLGAALRHGVNLLSARLFGTAFPWHTLIENVTGSLVMGVLAGYFAFKECRANIKRPPSEYLKRWYYDTVGGGRCPIVDTWWQTETGGHMVTPLPGVHSPLWAPVREPTIKAAITAETAILMDLMKAG